MLSTDTSFSSWNSIVRSNKENSIKQSQIAVDFAKKMKSMEFTDEDAKNLRSFMLRTLPVVMVFLWQEITYSHPDVLKTMSQYLNELLNKTIEQHNSNSLDLETYLKYPKFFKYYYSHLYKSIFSYLEEKV
jgi:hypothetical protein